MKLMMYFWLIWSAYFFSKVLDYAVWKTYDNYIFLDLFLALLYSYLCYDSAIKLEDSYAEQH